MKRFMGIVLVVGLIATGAALLWRLDNATDKLDGAREENARIEHRAESLSEELETAHNALEVAEEQAHALAKDRREILRQLRTRQPCSPAYGPHLWLIPDSGPVGTRVSFVGDCFVYGWNDSANDISGGFGIFLIRQLGDLHPSGECEQIVGGSPFDIRVHNGRAEGYFTVQSDGGCFQHDEGPYPVLMGTYAVGIGCHACSTNATFRVTD